MTDPLDLPITRARLELLRENALLTDEDVDEGLALASVSPDAATWQRFISAVLLVAGTTLVAAGILFFVAYNWAGLPRLSKLGLVAMVLCASTLASSALGETRSGRAALDFSVVVVGALLAVFGQVYQTGADTWQLFATWAVLALPFVVISHTPFVLALELLVIDTALYLYASLFALDHTESQGIALALGLVNGVAWLAVESVSRRKLTLLEGRTLSRLACVLTFFPLTSGVLVSIVDDGSRGFLAVCVAVLLLTASIVTLRAHHRLRRDVFTLTVLAASALCVVMTGAGRILFETFDLEEAGLLTEGVLIVAGVALAVHWLRAETRLGTETGT